MRREVTLQRGDAVPHCHVATHDGHTFSYGSIWQHRNLVLVHLPASVDAAAYISGLAGRHVDFHDRNCTWIVTRDDLEGLPAPAALIADRWGEIVQVWTVAGIAGLPSADELLEWADYIETRCPECEGEAK